MKRKYFRMNSKVFITACLLGFLPMQSQLAFANGANSALASIPQSVKVTGTVVDAKTGEPIIGCSVIVMGAKVGTITDANGNFKLEVSDGAVLTVSYVGYLKTDVKAMAGGMVIKINEDAKTLGEVVVTGLGIKREKKALGYTVTDVKPDELSRTSSVNMVTALQGKAAGVQITTGGGGPQSSSKITIRGNRSLGTNSQPIIVMDGIIIENDASNDGQWGAVQDQGNQMKNLNPDDFESISILKGAAASALYGSRAQNGVILISSKKGQKNKAFGVSVKQSMDFESVYDGPNFQNEFGCGYGATGQWATYTDPKTGAKTNQVLGNDYASLSFGPRFDGSMVRDADGSIIQWVAHPDNWKAGYQTAQYKNTNVTISGGTDKSTFRFSYGLNDSRGITLNNKFKRNNFSLRATHEFNNIMSIDAGATYTMSTSKNPIAQGGNDSQLFQWAYGFSRNIDINKFKDNYIDKVNGGALYNSSEDYAGASSLWWNLNKNDRTLKENVFKGNVDLNFKFTDWLALILKANYYTVNGLTENRLAGSDPGFSGGSFESAINQVNQYQAGWMFKLHKKYNDCDLGLNLGGETNNNVRRYQSSWTVGGLRSPEQYTLMNSKDQPKTRVDLPREKIINSFYAMANIAYKDQLYLDLTARNDYSSSLVYPDGHGTPSYFYPSAALSWLFNETFKIPTDVLSFGKLKGSIAWTGNDAAIYQTNYGFAYKMVENYIDKDGNLIPSYSFDSESMGNLALKNELTRTHEIGTELKFFHDRIGFDATYYKSSSFNQILSLPTASESGANSKTINAGEITNEGIELVLNATPVKTRDFSWNTSLIYSKNKNKIVKLADGVPQYDLGWGMGSDVKAVAIPGGNYGDIQTKYAYARYQALDASGNKISDPNNGQKVLRYSRGNNSYVRSADYQGQGYVTVGNINPDFLASWSNSLDYKDFTLDVKVLSSFGGDMLSASYNYGVANGNYESTLWGREGHGGIAYKDGTMVDGKEVTKYGVIPEGVFQKGEIGKGGQDLTGMTWQAAYDKGYVNPLETHMYYRSLGRWGSGIRENAVNECTWIKLSEVSLSYRVPKKILNKTKVFSDASFTVVGKNLFYLYNSLPDNINPEGSSYNNSAASASFEYGGSPYTRSVGFIVNLSF
jgi:iron complex outermembrane receptor protein